MLCFTVAVERRLLMSGGAGAGGPSLGDSVCMAPLAMQRAECAARCSLYRYCSKQLCVSAAHSTEHVDTCSSVCMAIFAMLRRLCATRCNP